MRARTGLLPAWPPLTVILGAVLLAAACAAPAPLQPFGGAGQAWPPPPEPARLSFVTAFADPAHLGIRPTAWARLAGLFAGTADSQLQRPMAVVATPDAGVVFVADAGARCVHRYDLRRNRYRCLRPGDGDELVSPVGLALAADGRLFVADSGRDTVYALAPGADVLAPLALAPPPRQPTGLAAGPGGELFVAGTGEHAVLRYGPDGRLTARFGGRGDAPGLMNYPTHLWLDAGGELLVTDTLNFRIQRLAADGAVLGVFGHAGDATGTLSRPKGVAADRDGHVYVVDGLHHALQVFEPGGQLLLAVGEQGAGPGEFWLPAGIFVTPAGLVFVADAYNGRVQVFRYLGGES